MSDVHPESGKAAEPDPIINRIQDELEGLGYGRDVGARKSMSWDSERDRRMIREAFGDDGAGEAILPGFGPDGSAENARDDCGKPHPFMCNSCGHTVEFGRTCAMSVCTRCARVWARDTGIRKSAKIRRVRKEEDYAIDSLWQKEHHLVLSPPPGWYYDLARAGLSREEAQDLSKSVVKFALDEMRAQGLLVRHSYRGVNDDGTLAEESDDRGEWKNRLFDGREWFGDVRDELAWKPHYHAIVVSDYVRTANFTEKIEEATGWVIHRITNEKGESLPTDGDMARAVTYAISHADIQVRENSSNRSAIWEVGAFQGDPIRSSGRFSAQPHDLDWADGVVRRIAQKILGIKSTTTDCGMNIPDVDDPDELARRILAELYPHDQELRASISTDQVLHHVSEGNIRVDVETTEGGGGSVTVTDAWGMPLAGVTELPRDRSATELPRRRDSTELPRRRFDLPRDTEIWDAPDGCGCDGDHDVDDDQDDDRDDDTCDGTLIPLDEARRSGLLDDAEWIRDAAHSDEALEADREWGDDLEPWRSSSPAKASPAIG